MARPFVPSHRAANRALKGCLTKARSAAKTHGCEVEQWDK